ncbi:hypothetical protein F7734_55830 [Scytonema sp. UIC 10036]|uniref:hypothetical protein n=1 Tax=Scytonema sp. UIC 10036 TaxID=2304196 RepID=UPI0012DAB70F|nr:hypothetical protein [Scytonema sp. UIC 10036]MUH01051.1 hypothetical protein [Scytonema sp. UIC 10036]
MPYLVKVNAYGRGTGYKNKDWSLVFDSLPATISCCNPMCCNKTLLILSPTKERLLDKQEFSSTFLCSDLQTDKRQCSTTYKVTVSFLD